MLVYVAVQYTGGKLSGSIMYCKRNRNGILIIDVEVRSINTLSIDR